MFCSLRTRWHVPNNPFKDWCRSMKKTVGTLRLQEMADPHIGCNRLIKISKIFQVFGAKINCDVHFQFYFFLINLPFFILCTVKVIHCAAEFTDFPFFAYFDQQLLNRSLKFVRVKKYGKESISFDFKKVELDLRKTIYLIIPTATLYLRFLCIDTVFIGSSLLFVIFCMLHVFVSCILFFFLVCTKWSFYLIVSLKLILGQHCYSRLVCLDKHICRCPVCTRFHECGVKIFYFPFSLSNGHQGLNNAST